MDENTQKDIINILRKSKRYDLIAIMLTIFEGLDSDFEYESQEEPVEEFCEGGALPEDPSYGISDEGFYYLK